MRRKVEEVEKIYVYIKKKKIRDKKEKQKDRHIYQQSLDYEKD